MNGTSSHIERPRAAMRRQIEIELLALDLSSCTRCVGSLRNIETAVATLRDALKATGMGVRLKKTLVASEEEARRHRFVASPTIRVNGRDLALETVESKCDSCTDLCGCAAGTTCRVWRYLGQDHSEAPVGLIVEALLSQFAESSGPAADVPPYGGVPENLRQFFAGRDRQAAAIAGACCSTQEKEVCCEADDKDACCASAEPTACGCR